MNEDDNEARGDPLASFSLEQVEGESCRLVLRLHEAASMEIVAEVRFDDPAGLVAVAEAVMASARVLATAHIHGLGVAMEAHGLSVAIEPLDLTDVDLTVDDILGAGPDRR